MTAPLLLALDWGTSSLRAYLLGPGGTVLDARAAPHGIMHLPAGGFPAALEGVAGDWRRRWPGLPAVASGMVGAAQGWVAAPYASCPAGAEGLAGGLVPVPGGDVLVVPGVMQRGGSPDVMRGEETQVAGALALRPELAARCRLVLPGTHSKWVEVEDGRIRGFETHMTGELFAVLREHSILGRFAAEAGGGASDGAAGNGAAGGASDGAFARGVAAVRDGGRGLSPLLFSARALVLAERLRPRESLDYLSGLLIGEELRCALPGGGDGLVLIGEPALCRRYRDALALFGATDTTTIEGATPAGLWHVAGLARLVADTEGHAR